MSGTWLMLVARAVGVIGLVTWILLASQVAVHFLVPGAGERYNALGVLEDEVVQRVVQLHRSGSTESSSADDVEASSRGSEFLVPMYRAPVERDTPQPTLWEVSDSTPGARGQISGTGNLALIRESSSADDVVASFRGSEFLVPIGVPRAMHRAPVERDPYVSSGNNNAPFHPSRASRRQCRRLARTACQQRGSQLVPNLETSDYNDPFQSSRAALRQRIRRNILQRLRRRLARTVCRQGSSQLMPQTPGFLFPTLEESSEIPGHPIRETTVVQQDALQPQVEQYTPSFFISNLIGIPPTRGPSTYGRGVVQPEVTQPEATPAYRNC